jgi:hypothetical protein
LLGCFERNMNDHDSAAVLNGQSVVFALICRAVWDTLARSALQGQQSAGTSFQQLFALVPVAQAIYHRNLSPVSRHLWELSVVNGFLVDRGLAWKPANDPGQDNAEEMRQYLDEARQTFRGCAAVLEGLENYEKEVEDLLDEE